VRMGARNPWCWEGMRSCLVTLSLPPWLMQGTAGRGWGGANVKESHEPSGSGRDGPDRERRGRRARPVDVLRCNQTGGQVWR
jgi:hypothetical protein